MQFTAPVSINDAARILSSHEQEIPVLADTVVEIVSGDWGSKGEFSVKRRWKAKRGWGKYTVVELKGTLAEVSKQETIVNVRIQFGIMAFVALAFIIALPLAGAGRRDAQLFGIASIVIAVLFLIDAYVLYRVINSLKRGGR